LSINSFKPIIQPAVKIEIIFRFLGYHPGYFMPVDTAPLLEKEDAISDIQP
jgi:hypothetical protein